MGYKPKQSDATVYLSTIVSSGKLRMKVHVSDYRRFIDNLLKIKDKPGSIVFTNEETGTLTELEVINDERKTVRLS